MNNSGNTHLPPYTGSGGERLNFGPQLPICGKNSGIISHVENRLFKRPIISETTAPDGRIPYKTEPCLKFQRGNCNYGHRCQYAHGSGDFPQPNRRELVAKEEGYSCRKWDENPRSISGRSLCRRVSNGEECPHGDGCHFSHENVEKITGDMGLDRQSVAISILTGSEADGECTSECDELEGFLYGKGLSANQVYPKPVAWKTKLCNKWVATGSCPYGLKCHFAHGESELQKRGPHNARGYADKALVLSAMTAPGKGIGNPHRVQMQGKQWTFKWKDIGKISRIYADWIDDLPLVHG